MTRPKILTAVAIAVAVAAAGATLASGQAPAQPTTLSFTATPGGGSGLDLGRKGPSVGDQFFENGRLAGAASGRFQLATQLVAGNARHGTESNQVSLTLPGGHVEAAGMHATVNRFSVPVTGGTGDYAGARGVLAVAPAQHGRESMTLTLER